MEKHVKNIMFLNKLNYDNVMDFLNDEKLKNVTKKHNANPEIIWVLLDSIFMYYYNNLKIILLQNNNENIVFSKLLFAYYNNLKKKKYNKTSNNILTGKIISTNNELNELSNDIKDRLEIYTMTSIYFKLLDYQLTEYELVSFKLQSNIIKKNYKNNIYHNDYRLVCNVCLKFDNEFENLKICEVL